jgi:hypothetical protein
MVKRPIGHVHQSIPDTFFLNAVSQVLHDMMGYSAASLTELYSCDSFDGVVPRLLEVSQLSIEMYV